MLMSPLSLIPQCDMRGKLPNLPAQMRYFHSQDGMGKMDRHISTQTAKGKKKGQKEVFWEWSQRPLFDPLFFCFVLFYKCRCQWERPGVAKTGLWS